MINSNDLGFVTPAPLTPNLRQANMGPRTTAIPEPISGITVNAEQLGEAVGSDGARGLFSVMAEVAGRRLLGRSGGGVLAERVYDVVSGYQQGRAASRGRATALGARRNPAADGNAPGANDTSGTGGGRRPPRGRKSKPDGSRPDKQLPPGMYMSDNVLQRKPNLVMPDLRPTALDTIEGEPLPQFNATLDYRGQLYVYLGSFATYWNTTGDGWLPKLYNSNSLKSKKMELVYTKLAADLINITTTKFTDSFTKNKFYEYIQNFTALAELIMYFKSVFAIMTKDNYDDYMVAHTKLQGWYTDYRLKDAMARAEQVLLGKYFPPQLLTLIYASLQLYKNAPLPQAINFRVIPRDYLLPTLSDVADDPYDGDNTTTWKAKMIEAAIAEIEFRVNKLVELDMVYVSKSIGFARPGYRFTGFPESSTAAKFDQHMLEHAQNMTRLSFFRNVDTSVTAFPATDSTDALKDRPYNINVPVENALTTTFGLQSMPTNYDYSGSGSRGVPADYINIFTTFAKTKKLDNSTYMPKSENMNIDNFFHLGMNSSGQVFFYPEALPDSLLSGRSNVLQFSEYPQGILERSLPPTKFSVTPPNCQRVYFNNRFAPTDAVTKLVYSFFDTVK